MNKILACDLDGVIFKFNDSYAQLFKQKFGIEFPFECDQHPNVWNWETPHATKAQIDAVWNYIYNEGSYSFWRFLTPYPGAQEFIQRAQDHFNDIYFITARSGKDAKRATVHALEMLGVKEPQVIIAHDKVPHLIGVGATDFLDDRDKNFHDVLNYAHDTKAHGFGAYEPRLWMQDRPWNRSFEHAKVKRIKDPNEVFGDHL